MNINPPEDAPIRLTEEQFRDLVAKIGLQRPSIRAMGDRLDAIDKLVSGLDDRDSAKIRTFVNPVAWELEELSKQVEQLAASNRTLSERLKVIEDPWVNSV